MLRLVKLVDRFSELERTLPADWGETQLLLTVDDDARCGGGFVSARDQFDSRD